MLPPAAVVSMHSARSLAYDAGDIRSEISGKIGPFRAANARADWRQVIGGTSGRDGIHCQCFQWQPRSADAINSGHNRQAGFDEWTDC